MDPDGIRTFVELVGSLRGCATFLVVTHDSDLVEYLEPDVRISLGISAEMEE